MDKFMTPREKIEFLKQTPLENSNEVEDRLESGIMTDGIVPKVDLRSYIREKMIENGVTVRELARLTGKFEQNVSNFLRGNTTLPLKWVEQVLWIFEDNNFKK